MLSINRVVPFPWNNSVGQTETTSISKTSDNVSLVFLIEKLKSVDSPADKKLPCLVGSTDNPTPVGPDGAKEKKRAGSPNWPVTAPARVALLSMANIAKTASKLTVTTIIGAILRSNRMCSRYSDHSFNSSLIR